MLTTTLNEICNCGFYREDRKKLLQHLGKTEADDEVLTFETILESNGLDGAIWCLRVSPEGVRVAVEFASWCAKDADDIAKAAAVRAAAVRAAADAAAVRAAVRADAAAAAAAIRAAAVAAAVRADADAAAVIDRDRQKEKLLELVRR